MLDAAEWKWICEEVKKDFGDSLTPHELAQVVSNGVKGFYNENQFVVNCFTIYKWIEKFLKEKNKNSVREIKSSEIFGDV